MKKLFCLSVLLVFFTSCTKGQEAIPHTFSYFSDDIEVVVGLYENNRCEIFSGYGSGTGEYVIKNNACFIEVPRMHGFGTFAVVWNNIFYFITGDQDENYPDDLDNVNFDQATLTISFYYDGQKRSIKLSEIPDSDKFKITPLDDFDPMASSGKDLASIKYDDSTIMYLKRDGTFEVKPYVIRSGTFFMIEGVYYINYGAGISGDNNFALIYKDTFYEFFYSYYNEDFWSAVWDNGLINTVSFDKDSETLILKTSTGIQKIKLSEIPERDRREVNWVNP